MNEKRILLLLLLKNYNFKYCIQINPSSESSKLNLVALEIGDGILVDVSLLINRFLMFSYYSTINITTSYQKRVIARKEIPLFRPSG